MADMMTKEDSCLLREVMRSSKPREEENGVKFSSFLSLSLFICLRTSLHWTPGIPISLFHLLLLECKLCERRDIVYFDPCSKHITWNNAWYKQCLINICGSNEWIIWRARAGCDRDDFWVSDLKGSDASNWQPIRGKNIFRKEDDKPSHNINILWAVLDELIF